MWCTWWYPLHKGWLWDDDDNYDDDDDDDYVDHGGEGDDDDYDNYDDDDDDNDDNDNEDVCLVPVLTVVSGPSIEATQLLIIISMKDSCYHSCKHSLLSAIQISRLRRIPLK